MSDALLTRDAYIGGRVTAWQPKDGYRAGTDPVFLAAACPARPRDSVLELGCGAGVASLCLLARVPELDVVGVERQESYADLARQNGLHVVTADLTALPAEVKARSFDHVIANPPYFQPSDGSAARDAGREAAMREETPLEAWIEVALARLKPKGWLTMIQRADRLPECLCLLRHGFGAVSVMPLQSRFGQPAKRVLIRARKAVRTPFILLPPFLIHEADAHRGGVDDFTEPARAILRDGAALAWA